MVIRVDELPKNIDDIRAIEENILYGNDPVVLEDWKVLN